MTMDTCRISSDCIRMIRRIEIIFYDYLEFVESLDDNSVSSTIQTRTKAQKVNFHRNFFFEKIGKSLQQSLQKKFSGMQSYYYIYTQTNVPPVKRSSNAFPMHRHRHFLEKLIQFLLNESPK